MLTKPQTKEDLKVSDDFKLVELWKAGSEVAYKVLFDRYFSKLYYYTLRMVSDREMAEEIVMDVMMNIWQKKHMVKEALPISAYLFRSVKNRIIDFHRKQALRTTSLDDVTNLVEPLSHMNADRRLMENELEVQFTAGLETLSPQKRNVFTLSRNEGLTYQEIAGRLNISKNTVENHMVAALKQLKTQIKI